MRDDDGNDDKYWREMLEHLLIVELVLYVLVAVGLIIYLAIKY